MPTCCLTYPHRGNMIAPDPHWQGKGAEAETAARFTLLCQCSPPTTTAIARPRSGLCCRLSTDLLLFVFVHAGCAHVSLASRTSQRLTNAYLTFVQSQSLQPCPPAPSVRCQYLPRRHHPLHWTCGVGLFVTCDQSPRWGPAADWWSGGAALSQPPI
jgi:hypothetical protein